MERCININTQILVSMQIFTDFLPKKFRYTCFFWLPCSGIFIDQYSKLVACGTQEGAIVIIGKNKNINLSDSANNSSTNSDFEFVSLLSGHTTAITDIRILNRTNSFLSVSKDSKICGWSFLDFSCEFQFNLNLNYGDYFFSICTTKYDNIWLIRYGDSVSLIDLSNGKIVKQLFYPGIKSFQVIYSPTKAPQTTAICIGSIQTTFYAVDDNFDFTLIKTVLNSERFEKNEIIKVCQLGIIRINGNKFKIYKANPKLKIIFQGTFPELPSDDFIKSVYFDQNHTLFAAGSFMGRFYVINIKENLKNRFNPKSIHYFYPFSDKIQKPISLLSSFAVNDQSEIIFSSNPKLIYYLGGQKSEEKVQFTQINEIDDNADHESDISYINNTQSTFFLRSHVGTLSFISFSTQKPFRTIEFPKKITALFEREIESGTEIVIGFEDGEICFYSNHSKFLTALTDSVQCFFSTNKRSELVAIGRDGSACLFFQNGDFLRFETLLLPIIRAYYDSLLELYLFGYDNGSFLVFSSKSSLPIQISMNLTSNSILKWPEKVEETVFTDEKMFASLCTRFQTKTVIYRIFDVPSLSRFVRENYFQYQNDLINDKELRGMMKNLTDLCNFLFDLFENKEMTNNAFNLVFVGSNQQPTFFYSSFKFHGQMICELSPFLGTSQFISYHLLSELTNQDGRLSNDSHFLSQIHFLPSLLQFLYFPDEDVQRIVCNWCITLSSYVSFQTCQEYLIPFTILDNIDDVEEYDKFLMSILIIRYPNTLPSSFINDLYEFLDELTVTSSESAVLALSILIDGISLWQNKTEKKALLYVSIIESILRQKRSFFLCNKFYNVACSDMSSFLYAFHILISTSISDLSFVQSILNLYTNVAFKNPKLCGAIVSDMFEMECSKFPQLSDIIDNSIESHSKIFQFVEKVDEFVLIGMPDGEVHAFLKGRLLFKEKIFDESDDVSYVNIGPDKKCAVAVSIILKKAKLFDLSEIKRSMFRSKKSRILKEFEIPNITHNCTFHTEWINSQNCVVSVHNE